MIGKSQRNPLQQQERKLSKLEIEPRRGTLGLQQQSSANPMTPMLHPKKEHLGVVDNDESNTPLMRASRKIIGPGMLKKNAKSQLMKRKSKPGKKKKKGVGDQSMKNVPASNFSHSMVASSSSSNSDQESQNSKKVEINADLLKMMHPDLVKVRRRESKSMVLKRDNSNNRNKDDQKPPIDPRIERLKQAHRDVSHLFINNQNQQIRPI